MRGKHWVPVFLDVFRQNANVTEACKAAGVGRTSVYRHLKDDVTFAADYEVARQEAVDSLQKVAWARAKDGLSDTMLIYLLKVHGGEEFRNDQRRQQEHRLSESAMKALVEKIAGMLGVDPDGIQEVAERVAREAWETVPR